MSSEMERCIVKWDNRVMFRERHAGIPTFYLLLYAARPLFVLPATDKSLARLKPCLLDWIRAIVLPADLA